MEPLGGKSLRARWPCVCFASVLLFGCSSSDADVTRAIATSIVNGNDDRVEFFDAPAGSPERAIVKQASVALMSRENAERLLQGRIEELPTWSTLDALCEGEPFAEQASAAFCSGTLLDDDLVLTSNHCFRTQPFGSWVVVFDYFYEASGVLGVQAEDIYEAESVVVAEERDPESGEGADYAWIRLGTPVEASRRPAPVFRRGAQKLAVNQPLVSASAGGGVPIKLDLGASIRELRAPDYDYFVADTDTSRGSSGAGAFTRELEFVGVLVRGGADFVETSEGCFRTARPQKPTEQFTHVHRAVNGLCEVAASAGLCRESKTEASASSGCSLARRGEVSSIVLIASAAVALRTRRRRR
ncbi:MAG: trypsin-like serine peptidase [Myxococcota bacterium]